MEKTPLYLTDDFGNKYRNPSSFDSGSVPGASNNASSVPSTANTSSSGFQADGLFGGLSQAGRKFYGQLKGNTAQTYNTVGDGSIQTPEMQSMYAANPTAQLDASGNWSNADGSAWKTPTGADGGLAASLGGVQGVAQGLGALGQLAGAYVGYKNYGLAKDQYGFENNLARANYENAAKSYNTNLQNSADVGLALAGSSMTPEQKTAYQNQIATNKVNTTL
jgi:hypothetical protein